MAKIRDTSASFVRFLDNGRYRSNFCGAVSCKPVVSGERAVVCTVCSCGVVFDDRVSEHVRRFCTISKMSDDKAAVEKKRGRPAKGAKDSKDDDKKKVDKKEKVVAAGSGDEDDATPAKRGRGRPKGSTKKKAGRPKSAATGTRTGSRGRPPKKAEPKPESAEEDEEEGDSEEVEEED